eukprot:1758108-Pyramimonas_sp.AAC.1
MPPKNPNGDPAIHDAMGYARATHDLGHVNECPLTGRQLYLFVDGSRGQVLNDGNHMYTNDNTTDERKNTEGKHSEGKKSEGKNSRAITRKQHIARTLIQGEERRGQERGLSQFR